MSDTHSAHLVDLSQIQEFRTALTATPMLEVGMRLALLDALDRWETQTPLQFFLCVMDPYGHVEISLCTESKLEATLLRSLEPIGHGLCAWDLTYINDRARMIWEDSIDLHEFLIAERPPGTTLH